MPKLMQNDPLKDAETDLILSETFYGGSKRPTRFARATPAPPVGVEPVAKPAKPTHYKIVCISLYNEDIERLEQLVADLKRRGHTKANKSAVIRFALDQVDVGKMPKGY
jgi:hypothetical protein